jgi:competence protein ComEC
VHDDYLRSYHLSPSRIMHRVKEVERLPALITCGNLYRFGKLSVLLIDSTLRRQKPAQKINIDIIILSKNAAIDISLLANLFECQQVVIDASNSYRKIKRWKEDCRKAGIACHAVSEQGAFVLNKH